MSDHKSSTSATPAAQPSAAWPRPTLTILPPLRDLTLQSGVGAAAIQGGLGTSSLLGF